MRQIDLNADLPCLYFVLVLHEFLSDKEYQPDRRFRRRNVNALPEGDGILVVGFFFFFFILHSVIFIYGPWICSYVWKIEFTNKVKIIQWSYSTQCNIHLTIIEILLLYLIRSNHYFFKCKTLNFMYCTTPR